MRWVLIVTLIVASSLILIRQLDDEAPVVVTGDGGIPERLSPDSPSELPPSAKIIVLDRSTVLGQAASKLKSGINELVRDSNFAGRIEVVELRDTALGYEELYVTTLHGPPMRPIPITLTQCPQEVGAYPSRDVSLARKKCEYENALMQEKYTEKFELFENEKDIADQGRSGLLKFIDTFIYEEKPTKNKTEIRLALKEIVKARCRQAVCNLFIFSDLLDTDVKVDVVREGSLIEDPQQIGSRDAGMHFALEASDRPLRLSVVAWGVGRSDVAGEADLTQSERERLLAYWNSFFSAWSAKPLYVGFEFPRRFSY